jgi:hypothetical protein
LISILAGLTSKKVRFCNSLRLIPVKYNNSIISSFLNSAYSILELVFYYLCEKDVLHLGLFQVKH